MIQEEPCALCLECHCLGVDIFCFLMPLLGFHVVLFMGKICGKCMWKVYKKYMHPFHLSLTHDSRGATSMLCLESHYPGVDIFVFSNATLR
jgi:hypothetical protein